MLDTPCTPHRPAQLHLLCATTNVSCSLGHNDPRKEHRTSWGAGQAYAPHHTPTPSFRPLYLKDSDKEKEKDNFSWFAPQIPPAVEEEPGTPLRTWSVAPSAVRMGCQHVGRKLQWKQHIRDLSQAPLQHNACPPRSLLLPKHLFIHSRTLYSEKERWGGGRERRDEMEGNRDELVI